MSGRNTHCLGCLCLEEAARSLEEAVPVRGCKTGWVCGWNSAAVAYDSES